ncbi:RNA polymerase sigma factor [Anatilimnocola aggregata]|uniref:RNA polymerase sigma factor n=1 Tax=Anatilimnocola aggregata TaxID=2528021 RepID=A0A517Y4P9_9BACT|nr:sigma-70 family RNA polymerase sigma factor [Anatilimnocola aggregata]QDU25214.1 RNA polymerase sigma factor [Anatilimnocola aggregata]
MPLTDEDRQLLQLCLEHEPRAWEAFVDRFLGLVIHVVNHTADSRGLSITTQDLEDLTADVFLAFVADDYAVMRRFKGLSSLATYLTVVARRVVVREMLRRKLNAPPADAAEADEVVDQHQPVEDRLSNREEVQKLMEELGGEEAKIVQLYHIEGKSYDEISSTLGIPSNSVGPTLYRARAKLRRFGVDSAAN